MAKGGGGAWKVAYADFVTAMMAFFLVMWLCAQDQKTKKAIADYFSNPSALASGTSRTPTKTGAAFEGSNTGSVPDSEKTAAGRGRGNHASKGRESRVTRLVSNWLHADTKGIGYWRKQALQHRESARRSFVPAPNLEAVEQMATRKLSSQLKQELTRDIPAQAKGLQQHLLNEIMADVNWGEIAEDLLAN